MSLMKFKLSLDDIEHYIFMFGVVMLILSFFTFELDLSIVDVIGLVIYLVGKMKAFPGFINSIIKFLGLMVITVIGIIVVVVSILLIMVIFSIP